MNKHLTGCCFCKLLAVINYEELMRTLSEKEQRIYDNVAKHATAKELLTVGLWTIGNTLRVEKLHSCIMSGMNWKSAFYLAKNENYS